MIARFPWQAGAICEDVDLFYGDDQDAREEALATCAQCPVIVECREYAIYHEEFGTWGGTSERYRRRYRARHDIAISSPQTVFDLSERALARRAAAAAAAEAS